MTYDNWLEQPFQEQEERLEAIEQRTEYLLMHDWNPQDYDNFVSAIADNALDRYENEIKSVLHTGQGYTRLGEIVFFAVDDYCRVKAERQAEREIDNPKEQS